MTVTVSESSSCGANGYVGADGIEDFRKDILESKLLTVLVTEFFVFNFSSFSLIWTSISSISSFSFDFIWTISTRLPILVGRWDGKKGRELGREWGRDCDNRFDNGWRCLGGDTIGK